MADNAVPTLAPKLVPKQEIPHIRHPLLSEKETLFASLAQEDFVSGEMNKESSLKSFFTGLLWFGYVIAIIVALVLIGSAAMSMMKLMSR